ncbi:leucine-rich repeat-containing protein 15-like [Tribolium madens]|uniref:leucine-rich repeat-containing protein 15-like n=1 Tax=Tribolium madens TaxID=41895 RepID=UPI001CF73082|nr:leucine-rich repeat-containing protein 15-like [Tribolium madens]
MKQLISILLICFLIQIEAFRSPWDPALPEVSNFTPVKGRPLLLPANYTKVQLRAMVGILFVDTFTQLRNVDEIRIFQSNLKGIEAGSLCTPPTLRVLELDFSINQNPPVIKKSTFANCGNNLESLTVIFNDIYRPRLSEDTFHNLHSLKELVLRNQNIDHLTKRWFTNLRWLQVLILDNCRIQQIDPNVFVGLNNLRRLEITHNRGLTYLPRNLFQHTPVLELLLLVANRITDITWNEFEGLNQLKELSLAANRIDYFDATKVARFMPKLQKIFIEQNMGSCRKKLEFKNKLEAKLDHPIHVQYTLDPGSYDDCKHFDD